MSVENYFAGGEMKKFIPTAMAMSLVAMVICGSFNSADCASLTELRQLRKELRFRECHAQITELLKSGENEAHFELAKTLLMELKWARGMLKKQTSASPSVNARELPYLVVVRDTYHQYRLHEATNRVSASSVEVLIVAYWSRFDYIRLVTGELAFYINNAVPGSANAITASSWMKVMRPMTGFESYKPALEGLGSIDLLMKRIEEILPVCEAIDAGKLKVDDL